MMHATTLPPAARPTVFDYFVLLLGCSLSLYLMELSPINVRAQDSITNPNVQELIHQLPRPMRLPVFAATSFRSSAT